MLSKGLFLTFILTLLSRDNCFGQNETDEEVEPGVFRRAVRLRPKLIGGSQITDKRRHPWMVMLEGRSMVNFQEKLSFKLVNLFS